MERNMFTSGQSGQNGPRFAKMLRLAKYKDSHYLCLPFFSGKMKSLKIIIILKTVVKMLCQKDPEINKELIC